MNFQGFKKIIEHFLHLHAGEHQAVADKVGGVAHALARFETGRKQVECASDLWSCFHQ